MLSFYHLHACPSGCVVPAGNASVAFNGYCYGTGVSMYMAGFKSSAVEEGKVVVRHSFVCASARVCVCESALILLLSG